MLLAQEMLGGEAGADVKAVAVGGEDRAVEETDPHFVELRLVVAPEAEKAPEPLEVGLLEVLRAGSAFWTGGLSVSESRS